MKTKFLMSLLLCALSPLALAAQQANSSLTPAQLKGKGLFKQRCAVCHLSVVVGMKDGQAIVVSSRMYGPTLTKDKIVGQEDAIRAQIMNGSDRMPAYKYGLKPEQITEIIEYLKTVNKSDVKGDINGAVNAD